MSAVTGRSGQSRPAGPARLAVSGGLLAAGALIFFVCEFVAAMAWTDPPYSYTFHYISNLGVRGPIRTLHQDMNSPLAWVMNTGFFLFGIVGAAGVLLLRGLHGWRRGTSLTLAALMAVGGVLLALNPGDGQEAAGEVDYHSIGALASIVCGNILVIVLGRQHAAIGASRTVGRAMTILGVVGLLALPVYLSVAGSTFGLIGLFERGTVYPLLVGQVVGGVSIWRRRRS